VQSSRSQHPDVPRILLDFDRIVRYTYGSSKLLFTDQKGGAFWNAGNGWLDSRDSIRYQI
jgi:hypothetical protein